MTDRHPHRDNVEPFDGHHPVIDPSAWVHKSAVIIGQVTLGARCSVWPHATLRGDEGFIRVGDDTNIQDGTTVHMTGGESDTIVGSRVTVGHNCILHGCTVEDDVLIGMGSLVMDGVVVGTGSYVGAGTLITGGKIIPPGSMVFGNPMRIMRAVDAREREWIAYAWKHYVDGAQKYRVG